MGTLHAPNELLTYGRWPSDHDLDLLVDPSPRLSRTFPVDVTELAETVASPTDLSDLGAELCNTLSRLAYQVPVPLDVFLGCREADFNLALWVEVGRPWLISWRYCGSDFFADAVPYQVAA